MNIQFQSAGDEAIRFGGASPQRAPLAPILAGARARGMADAFELLGVAAAFIDESGFALHINDKARRLLGPQLWVDDGRLRAADLELDEALSAAIESALASGAAGNAGADISFASESRGALRVKIMPVAAEAHDPFQLLRAVVVIEEQGAAAMARCDGLN